MSSRKYQNAPRSSRFGGSSLQVWSQWCLPDAIRHKALGFALRSSKRIQVGSRRFLHTMGALMASESRKSCEKRRYLISKISPPWMPNLPGSPEQAEDYGSQ
jgi:hypothetical protein